MARVPSCRNGARDGASTDFSKTDYDHLVLRLVFGQPSIESVVLPVLRAEVFADLYTVYLDDLPGAAELDGRYI